MPHFRTFRLDPSRLGEALPLVRMAFPDFDRLRWTEYCGNLVRLNGGVLVAATSDEDIQGLAIYHPEDDLRLGRIVRVDAMVAFELNPANPVRQALCAGVDALCDTMEARGILLMMNERDAAGPGSERTRIWERAGFRRHGAALWRPQERVCRPAWSEAG
ncbi:MAG: hypothetical protein ACXWUN_04070 [Allosphingosinicella sp.]